MIIVIEFFLFTGCLQSFVVPRIGTLNGVGFVRSDFK